MTSGFDLNNALGHYKSSSGSIINSLLHKPAISSGEITIDWYPSDSSNNYGNQLLRHTANGVVTYYIRGRGAGTWNVWDTFAKNSDLTISVEKIAGTVSTGNALADDISVCHYGHANALLIQIKTTKAISAGGDISITLSKSINSKIAFNLIGYSGIAAIIGVATGNTINLRVTGQVGAEAWIGLSGSFISA